MSHKLLTVVCALALVLVSAIGASAAVQNVKVGGDIEIKGIYQDSYDIYNEIELANVTIYDNNGWAGIAGNNVHDYLIESVRVYVAASLTDNVDAYVRLAQNRDWGLNAGDPPDDVEVDLAYLTLNEMYGYPCSLTIGRQELLYGEGFLVGDGVRPGTPDTVNQTYQYDNRKGFDAIKAVWDYEPHQIDVFIAKVTEGANVAQGGPAVGPGVPVDIDNDLYGVNWNYDGGVYGLWDFALFYNRNNVVGADAENQTWALSVRGEGTLPSVSTGVLALKGEIVKEWGMVEQAANLGTLGAFGSSNDAERLDAWGGYLEGEYTFDNPYAPYLGLGYIYMSGDNYNTDAIEQFNPLFEDEKYGEIAEVLYGVGGLLVATAPGSGAVGLGVDTSITNAQIWKFAFGLNPTENTAIDLTFYSLSANQEVFSATGDSDDQRRFIGSEYDLTFDYYYSEDVTFGLLYALFIPGPYFEWGADDVAGLDVKLENAQELMGSVKVTF